jgi:hypothetical protein
MQKAGDYGASELVWTDNRAMLIIAIAWLYVVLMMSLTQSSFIAGVATFLFYGVIPCSIVLYIVGTPARRARAKRKEAAQQAGADEPADTNENNQS